MELFDKVYGCYYNILRHMLTEAASRPITRREMEDICKTYGFQESSLAILPRIEDHTWPLFQEETPGIFTSRLHGAPPSLPLTTLQKSWLKSLISDPRLSLFLDDKQQRELERCLEHVPPLYDNSDFYYFDQYKDGDPYHTPEYREHFHTILTAIRENRVLLVAYEGKKMRTHTYEGAPYQLQYSSKDDEFRLCCLMHYRGHFCKGTLLNLGRIKDCRLSPSSIPDHSRDLRFKPVQKAAEPVLLEISGERNSLDRCMLHFANYEKHTEYDEEQKCWLCSIYYDMADETELLIEILSFGPVVRVLGPGSFVQQIQRRVKRQHELFYDTLGDESHAEASIYKCGF